MGDAKVEVDDGDVLVTLRLRRWEAMRLCTILMAAADRQSTSEREGSKWRGIAGKLKTLATSEDARFTYSGRHRRPPSTYENEIDMDLVLNGHAPYPVLSVRDMNTVWLQLEKRNMSARDVADRLHVHPRTVVRWRRERLGQMKERK